MRNLLKRNFWMIFFSYSLSHTHSLRLSLSLSHSHSHTQTHTNTLSMSPSFSDNHTLSHTHTLYLSLWLSLTHTYTPSVSLSHSCTHILAPTLHLFLTFLTFRLFRSQLFFKTCQVASLDKNRKNWILQSFDSRFCLEFVQPTKNCNRWCNAEVGSNPGDSKENVWEKRQKADVDELSRYFFPHFEIISMFSS